MSKTIEVRLWGTTVGHLGCEPGQTEIVTFEYSNNLLNSSIELSPIKLPNRQRLHSFPLDSQRTFKGLPGVFADSLPDKFGKQLIDIYMAGKGIPELQITTIDRLLYVGDRAMGAIEYHPVAPLDDEQTQQLALDIELLAELASFVFQNKEKLSDSLQSATSHEQAIKFIRVGSSAGGARSKVLVARSEDGQLFDGTVDHGINHSYWLLKFDSEDNKDRDSKDPKGMTKVEYIYSLIARHCDIEMPRTDFIATGDDFHFMIERFDRIIRKNKMDKLHYASWCGLTHAHRDVTGAYSYEQLIMLARQLNLGQGAITQLFKRAVFNIVGRNQDDHTKNFGFLMDRSGTWSLAPAFDMTYSFDPTGQWTKTHQIKLNNKQDNFSLNDLAQFGKYCNLREKQSLKIISSTREAFTEFGQLADQYDVSGELKNTIINNLRQPN